MVHSISFFKSITSIVNLVVNLPNGHKAVVTHIGTIQLTSTLNLFNVLCVPTFSFNLISVSQLTRNNPYCLIFLDTLCFIQGLQPWKTNGLVEQRKTCIFWIQVLLFFLLFPLILLQLLLVKIRLLQNLYLLVLILLLLSRLSVIMFIYGMLDLDIPPFLDSYCSLIVFHKLL